MKYDVFGIGSAIMDFLIEVEHEQLIEFDLKKGNFHLIDEDKSKELMGKLEKYEVKLAPGGSSANTLFGVSLLGGDVVFCGKVGDDGHGGIYEEKMASGGVKPKLAKSDKITGHAITFITPDSERTFAVHLGAAMHLAKEDVFFDDLKESKILHIEGYQLEEEGLKLVSLHAMDFAKGNGTKISIDLGDPGIVSRNKEDIRHMVRKYADIVFANEEEAKALTGMDPEDALNEIAGMTEIAIVKVGKDGSYIKKGEDMVEIPCYDAKAVDTTGAGDMYAAGVLFGISKGHNLKAAGHIGSYYASKVVERIGARLDKIDAKEVEELINKVK
ncbi:MAG: adenosine kinase [Candidatus Woesearchaeota archaeon]|jgi:sugar/nucleoside kinase (ribokinase family)|nr:adenosine kinase [Candidatus Woesearchaeota archaeon]